jgi:hypothetical protein
MTASNPSSVTEIAIARAPRGRWLARTAWHAIWFVIVPALLAGLYLRYLVPTRAEARNAFSEIIARLGNEQPVPLAVGLFLLFAMLFRYWRLHLPGARWLAEPAAPTLRARERRRTARAVGTAAIAGSIAFFLRSYLVTPCRVLSASMLPTLSPGDLIAEDRLAYGATLPASERVIDARLPQRGDIVVFRSPGSEGTSPPLIKRVVGLPGDRIGMHGSRATINGW